MRRTLLAGSAVTAASVVAALLLATTHATVPQQPAPGLPPRLAEYVRTHVKLTSAEETQLRQGQPVTKLLEADPSVEVSVFGAIWIQAPVSRYVAAVKDIENFEKGENFLVTKRLSNPPRLEDFAQMKLPPEDIEDLKACEVGSCELKVSEPGLARFKQTIDWSKPTASADVDRLFRTISLEFVNGYLKGGNAQLAVYRDSSRPTFVAQELAGMINAMPELTTYLPELKHYLLNYPKATLPKGESFLYWQEAKFGLKPTIRINHVAISEQPTHVVVLTKMLYASHYFWTAIELRVLVPDAARGGFWFATVNRSRSDGLSGFVGSLIRGKVRSEAESGMLAALKVTKTKLEKP